VTYRSIGPGVNVILGSDRIEQTHELIVKSNFQLQIQQDTNLFIIMTLYITEICTVLKIVIKSVQQCRYFLFFVNLLLVGVNYGQRTMQACS
jgi:hypothetical protein